MDIYSCAIQENADHFAYKMRDNPASNKQKYARVYQEFIELGMAISGFHEHPPEVELIQIGGMCINWLRTMGLTDQQLEQALTIANHLERKD